MTLSQVTCRLPRAVSGGCDQQAIQSYTRLQMDPHDVGEAAHRMSKNPKPWLHNLMAYGNKCESKDLTMGAQAARRCIRRV